MSPLPDELQEQWQRFLSLERSGQRRPALALLHAFILALLRLEPSLWHTWAAQVTSEALQPGTRLPIRVPLFQQVLLPALSERILTRHAGAARQLARLIAMVGPPREWPPAFPPALRSERGLLEEALRLDPDDQPARSQLIQNLARFVTSSLHELPSGVLYERNGATLAQCQILLEELDRLEQLMRQDSDTTLDHSLIAEARFHYEAYGEYLRSGIPGQTYQRFLAAGASPLDD